MWLYGAGWNLKVSISIAWEDGCCPENVYEEKKKGKKKADLLLIYP